MIMKGWRGWGSCPASVNEAAGLKEDKAELNSRRVVLVDEKCVKSTDFN